jgi:hypothetical protein
VVRRGSDEKAEMGLEVKRRAARSNLACVRPVRPEPSLLPPLLGCGSGCTHPTSQARKCTVSEFRDFFLVADESSQPITLAVNLHSTWTAIHPQLHPSDLLRRSDRRSRANDQHSPHDISRNHMLLFDSGR